MPKERADGYQLLETGNQAHPGRRHRLWIGLVALVSLGAFLLRAVKFSDSVSAGPPICASPVALPVKAPRRSKTYVGCSKCAVLILNQSDVWKNLDIDEAVAIRNWLWEPDRGLNLTHGRDAIDS
jgi:hypothetical protein